MRWIMRKKPTGKFPVGFDCQLMMTDQLVMAIICQSKVNMHFLLVRAMPRKDQWSR